MEVMCQKIGEHVVHFRSCSEEVAWWVAVLLSAGRQEDSQSCERPDLTVDITKGFGRRFTENAAVSARDELGNTVFTRSDYRLKIDARYLYAEIVYFDTDGLKSALLNWYSVVIAHQGWGLVLHSSCVVEGGAAHLFAGEPGAGKSTVACVSRPRPLLADDAALVKLCPNGNVHVFDSPFRNEFIDRPQLSEVPLKAIYLLKKSCEIRTTPLKPAEALVSLLGKIFYWDHQAGETTRVVQLCKSLVQRVPVYELEFQNNGLFWEAIS